MKPGRTLIVMTFVLGVIALWATRCSAQAQAMPETLSRVQAPPIVATVEVVDPRGELGLEILGGTLGLGMGTMITYGLLQSSPTCDGGHTPTFCDIGGITLYAGLLFVAAPGLASAGVMLAGDESGGNGKLGKTLLGAYLGALGGLVLGGMISRDTSGEGDPRVSVPVGALGLLSGAVLAYRSSSGRDVATNVSTTLDGRGGMFLLHGAL